MTRERTVEMRRLKRNLDQSVNRGLIETSWNNGQAYYRARHQESDGAGSTFQLSLVREHDRLALTSRPYRFQVAPHRNDKLLSAFCVIALLVLASIGLFMISG
jgi:hypothetical protein